MSEEPKARHAEAIAATLGFEGRLLSYSKSGYGKRFPDHVAVFNANVCVEAGKLWEGDLDLTSDEPLLATLSEQIGEPVFVLYEADARYQHEDNPQLDRAVYSITPSGHNRFKHEYIERAPDGTLRMRPRPPQPRWRWRVLVHRPRLLHFWQLEPRTTESADKRQRSSLLYVGTRGNDHATPLLVLGQHTGQQPRSLAYELTWYPAHGSNERRAAPRSLLNTHPSLRLGPTHLWLTLTLWPGRSYYLRCGGWRDNRPHESA